MPLGDMGREISGQGDHADQDAGANFQMAALLGHHQRFLSGFPGSGDILHERLEHGFPVQRLGHYRGVLDLPRRRQGSLGESQSRRQLTGIAQRAGAGQFAASAQSRCRAIASRQSELSKYHR